MANTLHSSYSPGFRMVPAPHWTSFGAICLLHIVLVAAILRMDLVSVPIAKSTAMIVRLLADNTQPAAQPSALPMRMQPAPLPQSIPAPSVIMQNAVAVADVPAPNAQRATEPSPTQVAEAVQLTAPQFDVDYLRNPAPQYPPLSKRLREQGRVLLRVRISVDGAPEDIEVQTSSGANRLDQAAIEAVKQWRFIPARRGDVAVPGWALVPINFHLA